MIFRKQLRSVIEWDKPSQDCLFQLWSENGNEIKDASKLIVKPGQGALFVYEGKVKSVQLEPGMFELETANIPFWTTLSKFMQAFKSEHKAGIYFFWQTEFLNQKWGTSSPITYSDPVYKFPVKLRAYGNYSFRILDAEDFFTRIVGGRPLYLISDLRQVIADRLIQPFADAVAEAGYSFAEIDKNREELSVALQAKIKPEFEKLGFELLDYRIESTTFDEETNGRIARIADAVADAEAARQVGLSYAQREQLGALRDAAKNPGGFAGAGVGLGAGIGLGQSLASGLSGQPAQTQAGAGSPAERLKKLKELRDADLITEEEFNKKKEEILKEL